MKTVSVCRLMSNICRLKNVNDNNMSCNGVRNNVFPSCSSVSMQKPVQNYRNRTMVQRSDQHSTIEIPLNSNHSIKVPKHTSGKVYAKSVEEKLKELTLEVEKDLQLNTAQTDYFGKCAKCGIAVYGAVTACQAMGNIYHNDCFTCCCCSRTLRGKAFFNVNGKIYCEEDYKYAGFQQGANKCFVCGHPIMEMILQALGKCYHPGCFRCNICNKNLDGVPFTLDANNKIYCVEDHKKIQEASVSKCAKCCLPIISENGEVETMKVVAMNKDFHLSCFVCESCGIKLTDKSQPKYFMNKTSVVCDRCHAAKIHHEYRLPSNSSCQSPPSNLPSQQMRHRSWEISGRVPYHHNENRVKSWNQ